ncbi:MAG: MBL fold metallo-hydrolase, partial [Clostridiales bacterium]|nr:MBL fold metallo-hydrolase [Clostridiales bacterium]
MLEQVTINLHSSIRIEDGKVLYFDPFGMTESTSDADVIFVTHDHYDHFSPEAIEKII